MGNSPDCDLGIGCRLFNRGNLVVALWIVIGITQTKSNEQ